VRFLPQAHPCGPRGLHHLPPAGPDLDVHPSGLGRLCLVPQGARQALRIRLRVVSRARNTVREGRVRSLIERLREVPYSSRSASIGRLCDLSQEGGLQLGVLAPRQVVVRLVSLSAERSQPLRGLCVVPSPTGRLVGRLASRLGLVQLVSQGTVGTRAKRLVFELPQEARRLVVGLASVVGRVRLVPQGTRQPLRNLVQLVPQAAGRLVQGHVQPPPDRRAQLPQLRLCEVPPERILVGELHLPRRQSSQGRLTLRTERPLPAVRIDARARIEERDAPSGRPSLLLCCVPAGGTLWRRRVRIEHTREALHPPRRF
jgi:hypothetical protein